MFRRRIISMLCVLGLALSAGAFTVKAAADELRNVKRGDVVPAFTLRGISGNTIETADFKGKVLIVVYLSAEQHSSELAAEDADDVYRNLDGQDLALVLVTADVVHQTYYEQFLDERKIAAPLGFDVGRDFYGKLGLIVMPTTLIIDKEGRLEHVISIHRNDYAYELESYTLWVLGRITDDQLKERLTVKTFERGTPKSKAARHRAAANLLREKGLLESAEAELNKALELDPGNVDIQLDLAEVNLELDKLDQAYDIIKDVLVKSPTDRHARLLKGIYLYRTGKLDEAESLLEDVLVLNPDPARTHFYLGLIAEKKGDKDRALMHYHEALLRLLNEPAIF